MPQQTNLNVAPYFDDFDAANDYHKVLFKPGYPVQARELTTLQSILQNQVEKFGQHFFKEGAKVIPGNTGYTRLYYCIQLTNDFNGIPVSAYADQLVGTKITGIRSGVTAFVDSVLLPEDSERGNLTLYISYLQSSTTNNSSQAFFDSEELSCNELIQSTLLGNSLIEAGVPFGSTLDNDAAAVGSSFQIENGVYFIRGNFINVDRETLILDQYSNTPSYRIGLFVEEEVINSSLDESLNDNSQGFNNYAAPGADRLRISTGLFKKNLDDFNDDSFIELATVTNGVLRTKTVKGGLGGGVGYKDWTDVLARRTYDESGDYYVKPFDISVVDSLNDNLGNNGIFKDGQFTYSGGIPSDDLALYRISVGKAYVRGYEVETRTPTFIDCPKPRTTRTIENQSLIYNTGASLKINSVFRTPTIGVGNTYVVSLRDERLGALVDNNVPGKEIGLARVYDFRNESGSYQNNSDLDQWGISLFDVQTFTEITLNSTITLNTPVFVKGANSGATGFLRDSVSVGAALTVYDKTGNFIQNESLIFDGVNNGRVALAITEHSVSDVRSLFGTTSGLVGINTFAANIIPSTSFSVGIASITKFDATGGGICTVTSSNELFPGNLIKVNDLISFSDISVTEDPIVARVSGVSTTAITVVGVNTVQGVANGKLPGANKELTDLKILNTKLQESSDNTLFTRLPKGNVANVDLTDSSLTIRKSFPVTIVSNKITTATRPEAGENELFLPFTPKRYSLIREDGSVEPLSSDKFDLNSTSTILDINGLGSNTTGTLIATLTKSKTKSKKKIKNRINTIIIDKSNIEGSGTNTGAGNTTLNDGLTFGNYAFGTRVQDEVISLNKPDVIEIHGVFESSDLENASSPRIQFQSMGTPTGTTSDLLSGEILIGQTSGAIAIFAEVINSDTISIVYKNDIKFVEGETLRSEDSNSDAQISNITANSFNISSNYTFSCGQEKTFYDYGTITRTESAEQPTRKLKVYYSAGAYDSTDDGDITTVESYDDFNYAREIQSIDRISNADIIDIRPRVSNYTSSLNQRSPLEFLGRSFDQLGNSAANLLASDEQIIVDFSYYQGRIDRIYATKDGKFQVKYGSASDNPEKPVNVDDALEIATITHPPYLFNKENAVLEFLEHKRYRMIDIKQLENRIKNLEYYTSLSLLETNTANLFVSDADGLNRFKSGFFVDNFNSFRPQDTNIVTKNSIDRKRKEVRAKHYTNSIDLLPGPVVGVDPTDDLGFAVIEGNNVRKQNDIVTLDYAEVEWIKQTFATRSESVTPFLISFWQGTLELTPATDNWVDTTRLEAKIINARGNYAETMAEAAKTLNVDPQTGFAPIVWDSWNTNWGGTEVIDGSRTRNESNSSTFGRGGWINGGSGVAQRVQRTTTRTIQEETRETIQNGVESRNGLRTVVVEDIDRTSVGDRVVSRDIISHMRSRNVQFVSKRVKPLTRLYAFFDGVDVSQYCVPKLLEINMTSGVFQVGEKVVGRSVRLGLDEATNPQVGIQFRVAQSNHREGPYDSATKTFPQNPYTNTILSGVYSSNSTILNVDTFSLSNEVQGEYYGYAETGMELVGETSGAIATINNIRLVSDLAATLLGSFYIPNPNNTTHPRFETGEKVFTLTNTEDNDPDTATTLADETYSASGTLETVQENIISVRNARIEERQEFQERNVSRNLGTEVVSSRVTGQSSSERVVGWYDPLAQSFLVEDDTGVFITKCEVFFRSKDDMNIPLVFQLRTMENGFPTQNILPFSEIVVDPEDILTSSDGSVGTTIEFKAPVYLEGRGREYAICLASNSTKYSVYISRIGENDLLSDTFISNQPYLGSLFKSQNASTWEASQWEDLKFTLYRADFLESGSVNFYNPELSRGNNQIPELMPNSLVFNSRQIRVGLGTTVSDTYEVGTTFTQANTPATGDLVGTAGSAVGNLNVSRPGIGYTPASGSLSFNNINLVTVTGSGRGATAEITVTNGVAIGATIVSGGTGYQIGDVVGITTIGNSVGRNARLTVNTITDPNELVLNNVQGDFITGVGNTLFFAKNTGITTELNYTHGGNVTINTLITENDGEHIKVNHQNHGMYFSENLVKIIGAQSDIKPTKLSASIGAGFTGAISVDSGTSFANFENVGVGTTNVGLIRIGDEIIEYTNLTGNTIGGTITRGSNPKNYTVGTPVFKYELNGISLARINKTHDMSTVTIPNPITFDSYNVKLDMSEKFNANNDDRSNDVGFPRLYTKESKSTGGYDIRATQNMPFEIITPNVQNLTVRGTNLTADIRTTTSQSIAGNEIAYVDNGFQSVSINESNYLETPRLVASKINEDLKMTNVTGNKSLEMRLFLTTTDTRISPVIDSQRVSTVLTSNRVNKPITDYANDSRVNGLLSDPTAFQYISKEINLENPATSLKILVSAHVSEEADIRAFFAISDKEGFNPIFEPFPGYDNLNSKGEIIDSANSDGRSDVLIPASTFRSFEGEQLEFKEHTFTREQLSSFKSFKIKILMTSTSQVYVPRMKDLRVIALA